MRFSFGSSSKGAYRALPRYEQQQHAANGASFPRAASWRFAKVLVTGGLILAAGATAYFNMPDVETLGYRTGQELPPNKLLNTAQLAALQHGNQSVDIGGNRRLRVFMPADSPHINLCKSVMSAIALGYPAPILLNWGGEFNRPQWHLAGSHIAKLESFLAVIEDLLAMAEGEDSDVSEDDLAVLVDAYDVWFQLPPSVLIERYHQLNQDADERVQWQWHDAQGLATNFPVESPRQSILVTTAKDCHPDSDSGADPHYDHWPESPMPTDMYGKNTDKVLGISDPARKFRRIRPRCINSGMVMGTMGSLRDALKRSKSKIEAIASRGRQLWSDQALFGEVLGEQELWREWMRELGATWNGTVSENDLSKLNKEVRKIATAAIAGERFEYGIGLDYKFSTIPPTCSAEDDGSFVKLADKETVWEESHKAGVKGVPRVDEMPPELRRSKDTTLTVGPKSLSKINWGDVSLYTDFYFGVTPVGIHHNAYVDNLKPTRLREWWSKMWFYPDLRRLIANNVISLDRAKTARPLARLPARSRFSDVTTYWASKADLRNRMVKVFEPSSIEATSGGSYVPVEWDGICQSGKVPWHQEIFGDDKGPWQL